MNDFRPRDTQHPRRDSQRNLLSIERPRASGRIVHISLRSSSQRQAHLKLNTADRFDAVHPMPAVDVLPSRGHINSQLSTSRRAKHLHVQTAIKMQDLLPPSGGCVFAFAKGHSAKHLATRPENSVRSFFLAVVRGR